MSSSRRPDLRSGAPRGLGLVVGGAALSLLALSVVWVAQCYEEEPLEIEIDTADIVEAASRQDVLRFAVAPGLSPERTASDYQDLVRYLASDLEHPVRLVQRRTYHEVNELLRTRAVQLALVCTGAYLHALAEDLPLEILVVPFYPEGPVYRSFLVVRPESGITSFAELAGHPFAFTDPMSLSGYTYPLSLVLERGEDPNRFFSSTTFTYSHDHSMRAVQDHTVDGAAVDSLVYEYEVRRNPEIATELRIIHESPDLGVSPIVVPASIDTDLRERLRDSFLRMTSEHAGRETLRKLGIVRFGMPPAGLYDDVAERFAKVRRLPEPER